MLGINATTCCGLGELAGITKTPPEAVVWQVCAHTWTGDKTGKTRPLSDERYVYVYGYARTEPLSPYGEYWSREIKALYFFTSVVSYRDKGNPSGRDHYPLGCWEKLVRYIRRHKLGTVTQGPLRFNRSSEPGHKIRAWIWAPDNEGMRAWWKKNYTRKELGDK